jgi:hypothetical protein
MTAKNNNMRFWDALGKTDPKHTKPFTRSGGYKGTAIKPMWSYQRMTEYFGPCGIGWGPEEPKFHVVQAGDEVMVYCHVSMWYVDPKDAAEITSTYRNYVYGVGGDKVYIKSEKRDREGKIERVDFRSSDEAYKAAYTDALTNAMKMIGVGADVHMGRFDDNKYVREVGEEFSEQQAAVNAEVERQKQGSSEPPPELDWHYQASSGVLICRILDAKKAKRKNADAYALTLKINNSINGKVLIYYFHNTYQSLLLSSIGKIVKLSVKEDSKGFVSVEDVLEVDGKKPAEEAEAQARLLASVLDLTKDELDMLFHKFSKGSWTEALAKLKAEKLRREAMELEKTK